jgi:cytochrome c biogenesis protein CcmG/thiol:disulfide interchange protein DsbE
MNTADSTPVAGKMRGWRRGLFLLALLLGAPLFAAVMVVTVAYITNEVRPPPPPFVGRPVPAFSIPDLYQPTRRLTSEELHGRPYLISVWGSWCVACRLEHPVLKRLGKTGKVRLIGFNMHDTREEAIAWLQRYGDPFERNGVVDRYRVINTFQLYTAPRHLLVDADGTVRWNYTGNLLDRHVDEAILPLLAEMEASR